MGARPGTEDDPVIEQKRGSTHIRYLFHRDRIDYSWKGGGSSRSFSIEYTAISRDRETLAERNTWYRNLGIVWIALGALLLMSAISDRNGTTGASGAFWILVGALSLAYYWYSAARYIILPCERGNLMVLDNGSGSSILAEIERRRAAQFRDEYDFFPDDASPAQLRNRFMWLQREGALSDEQFQERMGRVDAMALLSGIAQGQPPDQEALDRDS